MPFTFEVHAAHALGERGLLALAGEVSHGTVQAGMLASLEAEDGTQPFRERVHGVEYLDIPGLEGLPALTFHYRDPAKLQRWMALGWKGRTLSLTP